MLGRIALYGVIGILVAPLAVNVYYYFVEKELEENPVSLNKSQKIELVDGGAIYQARCATCHGLNGDGAGGYPRVNGEPSFKIYQKLEGYKSGGYGGSAKGVMALQVSDLSADQLRAISDFLALCKPVLKQEELEDLDEIMLDDHDISS